MHDLRALVAERSKITLYLRGETFELPHHTIGVLLEGFIKVQGGQEEVLLTAPAVILPRIDQGSYQSETSGTPVSACLHYFLQIDVKLFSIFFSFLTKVACFCIVYALLFPL